MSGAMIECSNCGHGNPAWAQVCRSCGAPILPEAAREARSNALFPTDQSSIVSMGATLGAIVLAIVVGLFASGLVPAAPIVADATPSPSPSASASASANASAAPSASGNSSASAAPQLIGTISFGYGLNSTTHEVTGPATTFGPGTRKCYSISLTEPFGVSKLNEGVVRVDATGNETVVQSRDTGSVAVSPGLNIAGFCVRTQILLSAWGAGDYIIREYRGTELIAEGRYTLSLT